MPLTIREKEEWQAMCNTRIDRAIEEKWAQAPALKDIVEARSLEQTPTPLEQAALNIKGPTLTDGPGIEPGRR